MVGYGTASIIHIVSLREKPELLPTMIQFFQNHWGSPESNPVYTDALTHSVASSGPLPQWYLAVSADNRVVGGCGLIPNDFISRMDLMPWLCALFVERDFRQQGVSRQLIDRVAVDAQRLGFADLYLGTDLLGFYEQQAFHYIGDGYQPWGAKLRIYERHLS